MGFFSKKVVGECFFCHKEILSLGILLNGEKMEDGNYLCSDCKEKYSNCICDQSKINAVLLENRYRSQELIKTENFSATKKVKNSNLLYLGTSLLELDEKRGLINIPIFNVIPFGKNRTIPNIKSISQIVDFEYMENGETVTNGDSIVRGGTGGLLGLTIGGPILGGIGAIVGAGSNNKKSKELCKSMKIKVTFNEISDSVGYINFFKNDITSVEGVKKDSISYKDAFEKAQECMSVLAISMEKGKKIEKSEKLNFSVADEILKFKQLLDIGVISQEEFDRKKDALLK